MENLTKFKNIAVLKGGISDEHEISNLTADEVFKTLKKKYSVSIINVGPNCQKFILDLKESRADIVFNCLHGFFGEDGQIQSILNFLQIPYTHSGVLTSSLAMNKFFSKIVFESFGIRCPNGKTANKISLNDECVFPIIIKPICGGSSNGLKKVDNQTELVEFIKNHKSTIDQFLFEEFIPGREITVGILDNKICGVMEIIFKSEVYDFNNKYISIPKHVINPTLPKEIELEIKEQALMIHKKLNCNCLSRSDFRYNEKNNKLYLLEINTQPGLTKNSLLPEMAKNNDISFLKLCEIILANPICEKF